MFDDDLFSKPQQVTQVSPPPSPRIQPQIWGVGALVKAVSDALDARFNPITVRGEISGFSRATSGHCYFTLKDDKGDSANGSAISCAMFRRAATLIDFSPKNGDVVELRGKVSVYEPRGSLQLIVEHLQRVQTQQGTLWARFEALKVKLASEGLFDADRKQLVPRFVRCVAVVTSLQAAALKDVLAALARRAPHVQVRVYPSAVQGAGAAADLVQALQKAEQQNEWIIGQSSNVSLNLPKNQLLAADAVLLVRGGGALEDLWAFNEEPLVRAVAACNLPIICGVGHETDFTLCDFAADVRAPTPTAAAELVSEPTAAWLTALDGAQTRLQAAVYKRLDSNAQRLDWLAQRVGRPQQAVHTQRLRLQRLQSRLHLGLHKALQNQAAALDNHARQSKNAVHARLERTHAKLRTLEARVQAMNPQNVLARGYAMLTSAQGEVLASAGALRVGEQVVAHLHDGSAHLLVQGIENATNRPDV